MFRPGTLVWWMLERLWPTHPRRWRDVPARLEPTGVWVLRLTIATVLAYLASMPIVQGPPDLTGALTALLVVQGTNVGTLRSMVVRIGAVVTGVMLAVLVSQFVGLSWWSLALVVALSLASAKVFRLGEQSLETPISAMLILAVQGQAMAVENRIFTTLIGAAIGFLFVVVLPSPVPTRRAAAMVRRAAVGTSDLLISAAESMSTQPIFRARAETWLAEARGLSGEVGRARALVVESREARRINARAFGTTDVGPVLELGVGTIERIVFDARNLFHMIALEAPARETRDDGYGEDVRPALAWVLATLADAIAAYGRFVEAEVEGRRPEPAGGGHILTHAGAAAEHELDEALAQVGEARAMLTDLMTVDPAQDRGLWLLRGSILGVLHQIINELEHEERRRAADQLASDRALGLWPRVMPILVRPVERPDGEGWVDPDASKETSEIPRIDDAG
ncbi:FUSC family protein [Raineyella fluvialis]|uniref:FUSC family protein n=1 Tax=Raineyella fluvialis TaxID=2662261 RepID=A0A5Q2FD52_9ACTN|nr:aromatic acid exporter family protein [Raineyella fluvialis]QGF23354.1 FUSC family protein [Raineyella fluvialis]